MDMCIDVCVFVSVCMHVRRRLCVRAVCMHVLACMLGEKEQRKRGKESRWEGGEREGDRELEKETDRERDLEHSFPFP